jgi:hypothetical protein
MLEINVSIPPVDSIMEEYQTLAHFWMMPHIHFSLYPEGAEANEKQAAHHIMNDTDHLNFINVFNYS